MSEIDRIISSLIKSDVPLERDALVQSGVHMVPDLAPLAPEDIVERAVDSIVGLGPLQRLLEDPEITDVLVNRFDEIWVERDGEMELTDVTFRGDDDVVSMVRRVIAPLGLRIDRAQPAVDARLLDGSRLHALIPPAAVDGPVVAIRRFHSAVSSIDDLKERGAIDDESAERLARAVTGRKNFLIAGPTGVGKTTLLNVLCREIPETERIVTIEDAAELRIEGHVVRLEARRANVEGVGDITIRGLLRHALRLRPDRIIVGEVRGPEALDMLQALNTGHSGSMSTIHANGAEEALVRLETLATMAPEGVPHHVVRSLVHSAIEIVVLVERQEGHRRVTQIYDVPHPDRGQQ